MSEFIYRPPKRARRVADNAEELEGVASPRTPHSANLKPSGTPTPVPDDDRYAVEGEHARGGLGRILKASDRRLKRSVAIKELLRPDDEEEARFVREALITARLQHPAIIPIQDVGRWPSGKPYYAMKLVSGRSLAEMIKEKQTLPERLALLPNVIAVADAVAYAHSQQVIHRDLNPSNVLIGPFGETVLIDWGLAVDLSEPFQSVPMVPRRPQSIAGRPGSRLTITGAVLGTPEYMPPEQAEGKAVDERADVYAIGAILYHLLAGVAPYEGANSAEVMEKVIHETPPRLEKRQPGLPVELLTVVRKAMARNARERYPSAKELAEDLKRFETGQLVSAHQYSVWALAQRWFRYHRVSMAVVAGCFVVLAAMALVSLRRLIREHLAEASRNQLLLVQAKSSLGRDPTATVAWLKQYPVDATEWQAVRDAVVQAENEGIAKHVIQTDLALPAISPDGKMLVTSVNHEVQVWDAESGRRLRALSHQGSVRKFGFSPDGKSILFFDRDAVVMQLWSLADGSVRTLWSHQGAIEEAIFSPDGQWVASASTDKTVRLWAIQGDDKYVLQQHEGSVTLLAFSRDGNYLASASRDKTVRVWNLRTRQVQALSGQEGLVSAIAFSADGKTVAAAGTGNTIKLWEWTTGKVRSLTGRGQGVSMIRMVLFSPHKSVLGSINEDGVIALWNLSSGQGRFLQGGRGGQAIAFSPSGNLIASSGDDGDIRLWDTSAGQLLQTWRGHTSMVDELQFASTGGLLLSHSLDKTVRVWRVPDSLGRVLADHQDAVFDVAFSPDQRLLASAGRDHTVRLIDLAAGTTQVLRGHEDPIYRLAFTPDGRTLASGSWDHTIRLWDLPSGSSRVLRGHDNAVWDIRFSADGKKLASASVDGTVRLWDTRSGIGQVLRGHEGEVRSVAFSPDGKLVASGGADRLVRLWDVGTGASQALAGHQDFIYQVAFSPDGKLLASASYDHTLRIWNLSRGDSRVLAGHTDRLRSVAFSPDGKRIASAGEDATIRIWNLSTNESIVLPGHKEWIIQVAFSPDGRLLASAGFDRTVRVWDSVSGSNLAIFRHDGEVRRVVFSAGATELASASYDGTVRLWPLKLPTIPAEPSALRGRMDFLTTAVMGAAGEFGTR